MKQPLTSRLAQIIVGNQWLIVAVLAVLTACASVLALQMKFDFAPQSIFAGNDELLRQNERLREVFGQDDTALLVVLEATGERDVLHQEALAWQTAVVSGLEARQEIKAVQTIADAQESHIRFGWPPSVRQVPVLEPGDAVDTKSAARMREFVDRSGLIEGALVSEDRKAAAVGVAFRSNKSDLDSMRGMLGVVENVLQEHPAPEGYRIHLTGLPAVRADIVKNLQADQAVLIPIAGVIYLAMLGFLFRRVSGSFVPLLAVGTGLAWTLAVLVLMGHSFSLVSNVLPILLLILGVSNCVHIISRYAEESEKSRSRREATRNMLSHMMVACLLTFATTAVGFLSLLTARSNALQEFAVQAAIGMGLLYLSVMLTLGVLLPWFRPPRHTADPEHRNGWAQRVFRMLTAFVLSRPRVIAAGSLTLVVAAALVGSRVPVNSYTIETYDEDHPTIQTMRLVEDKLGGLLPLEISLSADDPQALRSADVMRRIAELQQFAINEDAVRFARSHVDLHRELDRRVEGENADLLALWPPQGEEGEHRAERSARFLTRAAEQMEAGRFRTADGREARVLLRVKDVGTREMLALIDRLEGKLSELFPEGSGIEAHVTGDAYVNARVMDHLIRDLFYSLAAATVIIFAIIALLFRSMRVGMIAAVPNVLPLFLTLGYMGLRGFEMNAGNVIVFTISLGIAVDDTIHLLFRFREEYGKRRRSREGRAFLEQIGFHKEHQRRRLMDSLHAAVRGTGRPMVLMTILIVSGLAVLLFSEFVPTRRFAELTIVTMLGALIGDLLLLPALITLFWKQDESQEADEPLRPVPARRRARVRPRIRRASRQVREVVSAVLAIPRRRPLSEGSRP